MPTVTYERASRAHLGADRPSVDQFDLQIKEGEFDTESGRRLDG
jgi:hypothetical protein